ncbi:MAG: hypothetical protein BGO96_15715 [Micrococcales bacterium 73-15]|uniref:primosomal protein N' family DNA-binding protein n=1 Tax=Salana multivorans TaxID=120377 RepID=UPI00095B1850|nr:primosomal protein N' [Salana multivorans]OJX94345.1 MAG: hypothetical protein BGO96_15715 [Micrococcales bacterium 73-15]
MTEGRDGGESADQAEATRIAEVAVDTPLLHLDRPFDYTIPRDLAGAGSPDDVVPGTRVKVRFAGRDRDGWVLAVRDRGPQDDGRTLQPLRRLVSPVVTLTPTIVALARAVADRYVGTLTDVLRFAVPSRHARAETGVLTALEKAGEPAGTVAPSTRPDPPTDPGGWARIHGGEALLRRLAAGEAPRAVWTHLGGPDSARAMIALAARATRAAGRSVLVVVPDVRDVDRIAPVLSEALGEEVVRLVASDGPSVRARAHLRALTGLARVAVGTRSAVWAPLVDLGLVVCWDDGDDSYAEQRAPYPFAPQVLAMRAEPERTALLYGSVGRSVWSHHLVATGWAAPLRADRATVRALTPRVHALDEEDVARTGAPARVPTPVWRAIGDGLEHGPVLVQSPRAGYVPHLVCAQCREVARCSATPGCDGALAFTDTSRDPVCVVCGELATRWRCVECGSTRLRAMRVGVRRTAEELGRAFPRTLVTASEAGSLTLEVDRRPRIVVATPGAEPEAEDGYAAGMLLDAPLATSLPGLTGGEEALRRWFNAASLVRADRPVLIAGGGDVRLAQTLVRWDPDGEADRELAERRELHFPPTVRAITLTGGLDAVTDLLMEIDLPEGAELLGPFPAPLEGPASGGRQRRSGAAEPETEAAADTVRALVRAPLAAGAELSSAVRTGMAVRSAHKREGTVRVVVDPKDW